MLASSGSRRPVHVRCRETVQNQDIILPRAAGIDTGNTAFIISPAERLPPLGDIASTLLQHPGARDPPGAPWVTSPVTRRGHVRTPRNPAYFNGRGAVDPSPRAMLRTSRFCLPQLRRASWQ